MPNTQALDTLREYFSVDSQSRYYMYSYDHGMDRRLSCKNSGPACKEVFLKAVCAELSAPAKSMRRWLCSLRTGEGPDGYRWAIAGGSPGTEAVTSDLYRIGAALRCLMEKGQDTDEEASTLLLLPTIKDLWWAGGKEEYQHRTEALFMEEFTRAVAIAWLKCGGSSVLGDMAHVIFGAGRRSEPI